MKNILRFFLLAALTIGVHSFAGPDSDDFMNGIPPKAEALVNHSNWYIGPYNRWGLQHVREVTSTVEISRGDTSVHRLKSKPAPIVEIALTDLDGNEGTISDWLKASYTDGFLVLHKGKVLTEVYMNGMHRRSHHNFFSMSKSFVGNLAGILAERGQLDLNAKVTAYVPELKGSAYEGATVRHVLDMTIGMTFSEDYDDPDSDVYRYSRGSNSANTEGLTMYNVLPTLKPGGEHGEKFHYITANTDALGWIVSRAANRPLAEMVSTEIWSKLGAERDAYAISDLNGIPFMGGGLNTTLRDAARFGLMMSQGGKIDGRRVVPEAFIKDIQESAFDTGFPGTSYRNQWWVYPDFNAFAARGVAGQQIMIVPDSELVIVKLSSWPALSGYNEEGRQYDQRATVAIVDYIMGL
jgi:hypothetical protein